MRIDWRFGEHCGRTYSGFGTCGYMGPAKDCDCTGEKYTWWDGIFDTGLVIKCDGKASNFRDVPLPDNLCEGDQESRCRIYSGDECEKEINEQPIESSNDIPVYYRACEKDEDCVNGGACCIPTCFNKEKIKDYREEFCKDIGCTAVCEECPNCKCIDNLCTKTGIKEGCC